MSPLPLLGWVPGADHMIPLMCPQRHRIPMGAPERTLWPLLATPVSAIVYPMEYLYLAQKPLSPLNSSAAWKRPGTRLERPPVAPRARLCPPPQAPPTGPRPEAHSPPKKDRPARRMNGDSIHANKGQLKPLTQSGVARKSWASALDRGRAVSALLAARGRDRHAPRMLRRVARPGNGTGMIRRPCAKQARTTSTTAA